MNRFAIVIPPVLVLAIFIFFHRGFMHEKAEKERIAAEAKAKQDKEDSDRRAKQAAQAAEEARIARENAAKAEAERLAAEQAKVDERKRVLTESTEKYQTTARGFQAEIARLQKDLENARLSRDKAAADALDLSLDVERARIAKRASDNEIQRLTDVIQNRLNNSTFSQMPVAPAKP